jgi:hypothetical protein
MDRIGQTCGAVPPLAKLLRHAKGGLLLNEHIDERGDVVFRGKCAWRANRGPIE